MIYRLTRTLFRAAFRLYFKKVTVTGRENIPDNTPVILALNHPNSLLDALIVAVNIKEPINSLTRGDAFKKPWVAKILRTYNMIPVYRASEGKENIGKNLEAFDAAQHILEQRKTVLIFAEGLCENNWKLRPLKKGVARLAQRAWLQSSTEDTVVIPVGLTYQHYKGAGKKLIINFGKPIDRHQFSGANEPINFISEFNQRLSIQLNSLIYRNDNMTENSVMHIQFINYWNYALKNVAGNKALEKLRQFNPQEKITSSQAWFTSAYHASFILWPHYALCRLITLKLTRNTVFHDSVLFGLLFFLLPVYILLCIAVVVSIKMIIQ